MLEGFEKSLNIEDERGQTYFKHQVRQRTTKNQCRKFEANTVFPEKELRGHSPNLKSHVSVSDLYILTIDLPVLLQEICGQILGMYKSLTDT